MALPAASTTSLLRSGRAALVVPVTALALVLLSILLWSAYAGGVCGGSASRTANYALGWALPALGALSLAIFGLRGHWLAALGGVALGLAAAFAFWTGVAFPLCG